MLQVELPSVVHEFVEDDDYEYDHEKKTAELTREGRQKVRLLPKPPAMDTVGMVNIYQYIERAIMVDREYHFDRQYVVRDGEIVIVDEFTGRLAEGRKWRDGIHQAVEAKQGVEVTVDTGQAARITVQDFFLRYEHLAGMTGTAMGSARELRRIYRCHVLAIPTNRPAIRQRLPTQVFGTADAKWAAVVEEIRQLHAAGPAGADRHPLDRQVGAAFRAAERGGDRAPGAQRQPHRRRGRHRRRRPASASKVTVSTNMAGRGTDIKLGEGMADLGGLHVICTEMHDASRIDRQLIGRCGRQGDPARSASTWPWTTTCCWPAWVRKSAEATRSGARTSAGPFDRSPPPSAGPAEGRAPPLQPAQVARCTSRKSARKSQRQMGQDPYLDTPG